MDENPYRAPLADEPVVGVLSGRREDVRSVAFYQKGILVCILLYLLSVVGQISLVLAGLPPLILLLRLATLLVALTGMVFVFLLATKVYGAGRGILLGLLTLIPCLGLIMLLIVNGKATRVLQQNGYKVGLLGAKL